MVPSQIRRARSIPAALIGLYRRYLLRRALTRLRRPAGAEIDVLLPDLVNGWGNTAYVAQHLFLRALWGYARRTEGPILECGSGLSTLILGVAAELRGTRVWTLEHDPHWAALISNALRDNRISSVQLECRPLRDFGGYHWYDAPTPGMPDDFALVVCDGPPGETVGGRYGLFPRMRSHLAAHCIVMLDDLVRKAEQNVLLRWRDETPGATLLPDLTPDVGLLEIDRRAPSPSDTP